MILSVLVLGTLVNLSQADPSIEEALTEGENEKNVLEVLARKLDHDEDRGDEFCQSVLDSDPTVSDTSII